MVPADTVLTGTAQYQS